jgi:hypothetical protein
LAEWLDGKMVEMLVMCLEWMKVGLMEELTGLKWDSTLVVQSGFPKVGQWDTLLVVSMVGYLVTNLECQMVVNWVDQLAN